MKNTRAAHPTGSINVRPTPEQKKVFLIEPGHDYKIVINGKTFFWGRSAEDEGAKNTCENDKAVLTIAIGGSFAVNVAAQVGEQPGETST